MATHWTSRRVSEIPFAGIRKVFDKALELENKGRKVFHFEIGRPDFDTPGHIKAAAKEALDKGLVHYTPNAGIPALRKALSESIEAHKGVSYDPAREIMVTAGGQEAMALCLQAVLEPGDEVLIPDPGYTQTASCILLAGGVPVPVGLRALENAALDLRQARDLLTDRTRALAVNSPHNPTGGVLERSQVEELCRFAREHGLMVFSDEAYDRMLYDGAPFFSPAAVEGMKPRTAVLGSLSKTYSMTGWRIGYLAGPPELIEAAVKVQQNVLLSVCSFAQAGAAAALTGPQKCVEEMVEAFDRRRKVVLEAIDSIPGLSCPTPPRGAFYAFVRHETPGWTTAGLTERLLEEAGVAVVPGPAFGGHGEGFFRISFAASLEDCREGMERMAGFMENALSR